MKTRTLEVSQVANVQELIDTLKLFLDSIPSHDADEVFLQINDHDTVILSLIENILSDGSLTYDMRIS